MVKILVVEDHIFWGGILQDFFKEEGIDSEWVRNGKDAVEKVRKAVNSYGAIIMDINMPVLDGVVATLQIRQLGYGGVIISFSSLEENSKEVSYGLLNGMNAFIEKKIRNFKLIKKVLINYGVVKDSKNSRF